MINFPNFDQLLTTEYFFTGKNQPPIKPILLEKIPEAYKLLRNIEVFPHQCYQNAGLISICADLEWIPFAINYVEGEVYCNVYKELVPHAWNYLPELDQHFDLTWEKFNPEGLELDYYPIINQNLKSLQKQYSLSENQIAYSYTHHWKEEALLKSDENSPIWWLILAEAVSNPN